MDTIISSECIDKSIFDNLINNASITKKSPSTRKSIKSRKHTKKINTKNGRLNNRKTRKYVKKN